MLAGVVTTRQRPARAVMGDILILVPSFAARSMIYITTIAVAAAAAFPRRKHDGV